MVWNKNRPLNSDKIRISAGVIRDNWAGIENGEVPHTHVMIAKQGANPTATANRGKIFGKDAGFGTTELYYINDSSNVVQMTQGLSLGGAATPIVGSSVRTTLFTFNGTYFNTQANLLSAYGKGLSAGGFGFSYLLASNTYNGGTQQYTILSNAVFTSANFIVNITPYAAGGTNPIGVNIISKSYLAGVVAVVFEFRNRSGNHVQSDFDIAFFGGV